MQTRLAFGSTLVDVDFVYKDLAYILFNIPGLTSGVSLPAEMEIIERQHIERLRALQDEQKAAYDALEEALAS